MFDQMIGEGRIKEILGNTIRKDQVSHAYLFTGPKGIGKQTLALAFAAALKCTAPLENRPCGTCLACREMAHGNMGDFIRIAPEEGQRSIKIKQVRDLIAAISAKTFDGSLRICLITHAETMTTEAQNALLKSLEEPEPGNVFLITAENGERILPTLRSRCQVLPLEPLSDGEIQTLLKSQGYPLGNGEMSRLLAVCGGIPGKALAHVENADEEAIKKEAFSVICDILKGNPMPLFGFSEKLGKSKSDSAMVLDELIVAFSTSLRAEMGGMGSAGGGPWLSQATPLLKPGAAQGILAILFELAKNLQYNINLRLQWESTLLKIYELQEKSR
ncbi:DNA polymerase III subunit delta' [Eubacterium barkeri]|uniref:DNA polymerase-3 subunit delta n=1 Tax=Eubacterium barkeri TaxID=1528 RepID=A0A1H3GVG8_EUBBA|nr:DNA polymerase III subunit delta' [Eubacterium barkeri]SDY06504.1 DNA polymerase-3 subunit delta' [Eubacterium barkeri]